MVNSDTPARFAQPATALTAAVAAPPAVLGAERAGAVTNDEQLISEASHWFTLHRVWGQLPSDLVRAIAQANELLASLPHTFSPQQFSNPANPKIHAETTGPELWQQTEGQIAALVVGVGTGGTLTGAGYYLKQQNPALRIIAVEPAQSAVLSGQPAGQHNLQGIGAGFIPDVLRVDLIDEIIPVSEAEAYRLGRQLARQEGILSGISTGAALYAGLQVGQRPEYHNRPIVIVQPSGGERYLSTALWQGKVAESGLPLAPSNRTER